MKRSAKNPILAYTRATVKKKKKIGLDSLCTKLLGDATSQVLSIRINLC